MAVHAINIEKNYGTVIVYGGEVDAEVTRQRDAGVSDEVLEDIGYLGAAATVTAERPMEESAPPKSDTMDLATFKRLAAEVTMHEVSMDDEGHASLRAMYMQGVAGDKKDASKARRREGHLKSFDRQPEDRKRVEELQLDAKRKAAINLRRACGHCALRDGCRIYKEPLVGPDVPKHEIVTPARAAEISLNRWLKRHPYADRADNREQRPRNQFSRELDENPLKDCRPDTAKR